MSSILSNFKREKSSNFWELNPEFKNTQLYDLYKEDTSKDKSVSSTYMWAIANLIEVKDNALKNLPINARKNEVEKLFTLNIDWIKLEKYISLYTDYTKSAIEKQLFVIESKLQERNNLFEETPYTFENAEKLDKLIMATDKIQEQYKKLKQAVEEENSNEAQTKGGRKESLSEKKLLFGN